jgi:hypothetical protein
VRAYAFGHEGAHASRFAIVNAPMPEDGLDFGVTVDEPADGSTVVAGGNVVAGGRVSFPELGSDPTGAGDHPTTRKVQVSVDDPLFGSPTEAAWDAEAGTWSASLGALSNGSHTVHARASMDQTVSDVASSAFTVAPPARVEWQVVARNAAPAPDNWRTATGVESWAFSFSTEPYAKATNTIVARLVEGDLETARSTARARFR